MNVRFVIKSYDFDSGLINVDYYPKDNNDVVISSAVPIPDMMSDTPTREQVLQHIGSYYERIAPEQSSLTEEEAEERDTKYSEIILSYQKIFSELVDDEHSITVEQKQNFNTSSRYGSSTEVENIEHIVLNVLKKVGIIR